MRVLLTTHNLHHFAGSELNIYELANAFKDRGDEVDVVALAYGEPINTLFDKANIEVFSLINEHPRFKHYDLIWAQHAPVLDYVLFRTDITADRIVFSSLSHFEPLEAPPIYVNELTRCIANSEENREKLVERGVKIEKIEVFPNSVKQEFFDIEAKPSKSLQKLAIVSNHVPSEVEKAVEALANKGVKVDIFGHKHKFRHISPDLLVKYDAVVSIGRTVQYGLSLGIPVYCYDHFGGPGWINKDTFKKAFKYNFSGRGFDRHLNTEELVKDIIEGYSAKNIDMLRKKAKDLFSFEVNFQNIIENILKEKALNSSKLKSGYGLIAAQNEAYVREFLERLRYNTEVLSLKDLNLDLNQQVNEIIESKDIHIKNLEARIEGMRIKNRFLALINPITPGFMKKILEALLRRISKAVYILKNDGPVVLVKNTVGFLFDRNYSHLKMYTRWIRKVESKWLKESKEEAKNFNDRDIKISIVMPVYNIEPKYLKKAIKSLRNQTYPNWELCMHDDASINPATIEYLKKLDGNDERIKISFGEENGHISYATNQALKLAEGEFVLFMDNDDELAEVALYEIVKRIKENPKADLIYYDEDVISQEGRRIHPIFKPQYSPDTLLSIMYMAHSTYRRSLLEDLGGMREGYEGSQDYDLCLRAVEKTEQIEHIPHILYHWRQAPGSTAGGYDKKDYVYQSAWKAHEDAIERRNLDAEVEEGLTPVSFRIKYSIKDSPKVSVIIPTKDHVDDVEKCITSIREKTDYDNYEILIVNNNSEKMESKEYFEKISQEDNIRVLDYPRKFNFAAINNFAVKQAKGEHVLLLNNDTEVITPGWMSAMLEFSHQDRVGVVGAMLLFPDDTFQHAGCVLGLGGIAGHIYVGHPKVQHGLLDRTLTIHNTSAVTAACLMIRKDKYEKVGGMDEKLAVAFNDIDFCINVMESGYDNIYTPFAQLYHFESKTRGYEDTLEKQLRFKKEIDYMKDKWGDLLENDPYYNPNLSLKRDDFSPRY